jgi:succinate-semialdehyde dehydrogenase / glutarate-semialdehyde dehydrogenase
MGLKTEARISFNCKMTDLSESVVMSNSLLFRSVNPWTGEEIFHSDYTSLTNGNLLLEQQWNYWRMTWARMPMNKRLKLLEEVPYRLEADLEKWALILTREMGKPIDQSKAEIQKCINLCHWYLKYGPSVIQENSVANAIKPASARYDPLGIVLGVMPWNFPFWQVFRFAFPNLLAGNVVALKPAPTVGLSGLALQAVFGEFPGFQTYFFRNEDIAALIRHESICGIAFTGSEETGRLVAAHAGSALKPCVLELGGSDPAIVSDSCDVQKAAESLLHSRTINNGQTCIAAKRWIVHRHILGDFLQHVRSAARALKVGPPMEPGVWISCMSNEPSHDRVLEQIHRAKQTEVNYECLISDTEPHALRMLPSLLLMSKKVHPWYYEELFGPVAFVQEYDSREEAVRLANDTRFGLAATVWTDDEDEFHYLCESIAVGNIARNQIMSSDPSIPFGGIKNSGFGKELGDDGLFPFLNKKHIHH